ncbi:MAG: serine protease Do [Deltaproteobacteria bacterium]|nr:MAG: serine protease Do [Deltaproteobacteria bacterium]
MVKILRYYVTGLSVFLIFTLSAPSLWAAPTGELERRRTPVVRVVEKVSPSVVNISTEKVVQRSVSPFGGFGSPFFDSFFKDFLAPEFIQRFKLQTLGSGIVFSGGKRVVTNEHVIDQAQEISVITNKGKRFSATLVGADPVTDLAVLKIKGKTTLPPIQLGTSSDLMIGETVIAIGNPFGLSNTVTTGVISSLHRSLHSKGRIYKDLIQTDASINPGNSGGPLLNILGKVIGINTAIYGNAQGIGFAIPIDKVRRISSALIEYGEVPPVWIGIDCQALTPAIARHFNFKGDKGILVTAIEPGSPAARADLKAGDIVVSLNHDPVLSTFMFQQILNQHLPGDHIDLTIIRNGKTRKLALTLKRLTPNHGAFLVRRIFGFELRDLNRKERHLLSGSGVTGIAVSGIIPHSFASSNGLRKGDILLRLNGKPLKQVRDFRKVVIRSIRTGRFEIVLLRGGYTYKIVFDLYQS